VIQANDENETSPLIQKHSRTYEESFTGLASFFPCSRSRHCTCCCCCSI